MIPSGVSLEGGPLLADSLPRTVCERCRRPQRVCYCAHLTPLPTRTRVLVLQHPREQRMPVGTARMAHLALPQSRLCVGVDFREDPIVQGAIGAGNRPYLLFPGPAALPVERLSEHAAVEPITLVVLDGTWWQARKLLKVNPQLATLPRVGFAPRQPSAYRIRRQPADFCVSTVEALAHVLGAIEPDANGRFARLLDPFHAMVEQQERFETEVRAFRHRRATRVRNPRPPTLAERLSAAWPTLVCMQGEANAWPARTRPRAGASSAETEATARRRSDEVAGPPEIVHWVACRPATGESFNVVIAPEGPLAPSTPGHIGLLGEDVLNGVSAAAWHESWHSFIRPGDTFVVWGRFYEQLARTAGLPIDGQCLDMRALVSQMLRKRVGTIHECQLGLGIPPLTGSAPFPGRGGARLAALAAIVTHLKALAAR